ncbi:PIN domain nuclease [Aliifodinibius salipaludis]|uniref:PIN domain nuclease n=1 Tax=Fodinibius salipaludis TaxID=2032627 RepID=A0A2A2GD07_9BACT|nr:PIN domain-containing protein [Aliifodinibius salipaludis]PAU94735.1 PIN domain nuclease [Aliifodinibius salipaludis]
MTLTKVLIDTNICLDAIIYRRPYAAQALELIERSESKDFRGIISAHSFDTLFYILNKKMNRTKAYKGLKEIRRAFDVAPVTSSVIDSALDSQWNDFEDAIHYFAAKSEACKAIVTRNQKDFDQSEITILSPMKFLNQLDE